MVHEMIHYYLYLNDRSECSAFSHFLRLFGFKSSDHGPEFMAMAQKLNEQYGLNITKTYDASSTWSRHQLLLPEWRIFRQASVHGAPLEDSQLGLARNLSILPSRFT